MRDVVVRIGEWANRQIREIQNGSGVNRENIPQGMRAVMAREYWHEPIFAYGTEYGYLLAMVELRNEMLEILRQAGLLNEPVVRGANPKVPDRVLTIRRLLHPLEIKHSNLNMFGCTIEQLQHEIQKELNKTDFDSAGDVDGAEVTLKVVIVRKSKTQEGT